MKTRRFGGLDADVSTIGFGVWTVATDWWGVKDSTARKELLVTAADCGINFFDTGDVYGDGFGESILKETFGSRMKSLVIATKFGYNFYDFKREGHKEHPQDFSEKFIRRALENSLKRLGVECIDMYQLHNPKLTHITDELVSSCERLVKEGKVRCIGAAIGPDIGWFKEGCTLMEKGVVNLQIIYSILEQQPARDLIAFGKNLNARFIVRVPHASGLLDGTVTSKTVFDKDDHRSFRKRAWLERASAVVDRLNLTQHLNGLTPGQIAIAFCLSEESVTTVLPNFTRVCEIKEWSASSDATISDAKLLAEIFDIYYRELHRYAEIKS